MRPSFSTLQSTCVNLNLVALNLDDELKQLIQTFNLHKKRNIWKKKRNQNMIFLLSLYVNKASNPCST